MDDWVSEILGELGFKKGGPAPTKYQLVLAKHRMITFGSVDVEIARIKAALDHDYQVVQAATLSLLETRDGILDTPEVKSHPAIAEIVTSLYGVTERVLNRVPTTSIELRRILRSVSGDDEETERGRTGDIPQ